MPRFPPSQGAAVLLVVLTLAVLAVSMAAAQLAHLALGARREAASERALAAAREALLAYAADRPIDPDVGPGYLPCPDLDGDGWAEGICGSLDGDRGNAERLGRLPWKTLGLEDLRDGHGERLWYAVATRYKGLLNCAASAACVDMTPATAVGSITVRDADGRVSHDGTLADAARPGAAAVVIAPGPALVRAGSAFAQRRGACAGRCDPRDYLEAAPPERGGEDNADFSDRLDTARAANANGFIRGPVHDAGGIVRVNDRVLAIEAREVMRRAMRRVALEVAHCLRFYASRPENGGRYPWPDAACGAGPAPPFGRVPDTPFEATRAASGGRMLARWWRGEPRVPESLAELPTAPHACRIAVAPADEGPVRTLPAGSPPDEGETAGRHAPAWWRAWRPFVFFAPAPGFAPTAAVPGCGAPGACLSLESAAGEVLAGGKQLAVVVAGRADECLTPALVCGPSRCTAARSGLEGHELAALP